MKKHEKNEELNLDRLNKLLVLLKNGDNAKYQIQYYPNQSLNTKKIEIWSIDEKSVSFFEKSPYDQYKNELGYFASLAVTIKDINSYNRGKIVSMEIFIEQIELYLKEMNSIEAEASPDSVSSVISENDLQNNSQMSQSSEKYSQKDEIAFQFDSSRELLGVLIASGVTLFSIASLTVVIPLVLPSLAILIAGIISLSYLGYKMYQYSGFFKFDENKMVPVISSSNSTLSF